MTDHPSYDAFWQGQALDKLLAANPSNVPTLWEQGLFDQEDMYGAIHAWEELRKVGKGGNNFLVMGPWRHSQFNYNGSSLGAFNWNGDTALEVRRDVLLPFFNAYLKDGAPAFTPPAAQIYNTGSNRWDRFTNWPTSCLSNCPTTAHADLLPGQFRARLRRPRRKAATAMSPIPPSRSRICRARSISTTAAGAPSWSTTSASPTAAPTC